MGRFWVIVAALMALSVPLHAHDIISSEMVQTGPGEQALKQTLIVDADLETSWSYYTNPEYITRWMTPVAQVDLATGGAIRTNYDACAAIGDEGTITLNIVNFVPQTMLTLQASLDTQREAEWMSDEIWAKRDRLYNVITFEELADGRTQIVSWGLGYGTSEAWQQILGFFIAGNEWSYAQLHRAIAGEQVFGGCAEAG